MSEHKNKKVSMHINKNVTINNQRKKKSPYYKTKHIKKMVCKLGEYIV